MKDIHEAGDALKAMGGYWYLASPYTKTKSHLMAWMHACWAAAELIGMGARVFSPIAHSHSVATLGALDRLDGDLWEKQNEPFMRLAHGLIVLKLPGWDESDGVRNEIAFFEGRNRPIYAMEPKLSCRNSEQDRSPT